MSQQRAGTVEPIEHRSPGNRAWVVVCALAATVGSSGCASSVTVDCGTPGGCPEPDGDADADADGAGDGDADADRGDGDADADGDGDGDDVCATADFEVTETQELFVVPDGVTFMHVKAWGAGGNGEGVCENDDSGLGGFTEAVFPVTPGTELAVIVGKRGRAGISGEEIVRFGFGSWGGGGLSGVFRRADPITEADRDRALVIAGGGGSAGAPDCAPGGTGNADDAGGQGTMMGSAGADDINGGGGGYEGGTGGARREAGRGGSGSVDPSAVDSVMLFAERGTGLPPRTDDPDWDGVAGMGEQSGSVVIHFSCEPPDIF